MIALTRLPTITNGEELWNQIKDTIHKGASATLGVTKSSKRYINQDTWLLKDDVQMNVREKKRHYHKFLDDKTLANWQINKSAKQEAMKVIAATRAVHCKNLYDKLETQDGARNRYRLAKTRPNAERKSYTSVALMTRTLCLPTVEPRRIDDYIRETVEIIVNHDSQCWPNIKDNERRLAVMETKMLRWTSGEIRFDHIRNEDEVAPIVEKLREGRPRWYGHVICANENELAKIGLNIEVDGNRLKSQPEERWLDTLDGDLKASPGETDHDEPTPLAG